MLGFGDDVPLRRWRRCTMGHLTHLQRVRQRARWRRGLSSGADELGDVVDPILIEVVSRAIVQKLVRHDQHSLRIRRPVMTMRR